MPRGHTVQALAAALRVPLEALHAGPEEAAFAPEPALAQPEIARAVPAAAAPALPLDFLQLLNLSALSFLVLPLLNLSAKT